ncbi:ATP-binding protein [Occallatibacter savannae]|uniref:ATP-binding protein n=1 Tax=Occallatibacter savannae TaxID=1002691 RepID=UPI000D69A7B3|nr:ATP-binding protein [Occallatibacter savannae]
MEEVLGTAQQPDLSLFSGSGEMACLMRELDWESTPLGSPDGWPRSLRVAARMLLGSGYPMYIAWGPQFIQIYNHAYRPILGKLKHPAALGNGTPQTFPELWEFIGPMFLRVLEHGQETTLLGQALYLNRNGYLEECYYDFSYSPIPDDDPGKVGGVFVTCTEITGSVLEQRRLKTVRDLGSSDPNVHTAEEVCIEAAEVLGRNNLDIPFAALYLVDESGATARLAAATGVEAGDPICPVTLPISDEGAWPVSSALESSPLQHVPDLAQRFAQIPTGGWPDPPAEAVLIPFTRTSLQPVGFIVMGVNPRKQFDTAMEQFLVRCAQTIGGRIASVRAYEDARRRLESLAELDRAKTVFFSNISHEFRTPLTLIASPLDDLANSESLSRADRETIQLAKRNVIRLQRLVNNLLDFSRIEAGRANANFEAVDLVSMTAEIASGFRSTFEKAGLSLSTDAEPLSEKIYIDREMWEKILLNLLSNAFKFTFSGGVTVSIDESADSVCVNVADTGVGIPSEEIPRIFERFHRIEGTRGRSYEGTGIGLALVNELVKIHGGSIQVTSEPGVGTRFEIRLPKGTAHLDPEQVSHSNVSSSASLRVDGFVAEALRWIDDPPAGDLISQISSLPEAFANESAVKADRRRRVLLVDDNADMREYMARLLEPFFEIEIARDGSKALQRIASSRPDLVMVDAMMPVMDGYELLKQIRENPELASLPVIMVSARAGTEMEIQGREAGADDYVSKPFSSRELVTRVRAVLKVAEIRAASEAAIRASENRSRQVLERTTDAVFVLDRDWCFTYLNPNALRMISGGRNLIGKNVWEEFPDAVGRAFWKQYHRVMDEGVSVQFNEYYPAPLDKWFEVHAYPTEEGLAAFFRDITLKLKSDAALRQNEKLAAVGRLASSIAHEINNPLEAITNLLYLMEMDELMQPRSREFLRSAQAELSRVSHIATQTLHFQRQSKGRVEVITADLLDSVIALYRTRFAEPGVVLERDLQPESKIMGYPGDLRQVFSNLLRNALEAIGSNGRISIRERICTDPESGRRFLRITVADSGHGMTPDVQKHLFEPFFSTKPATGTGLGLWVSKEIIDKHSGRIVVRSSTHPVRHGTVFSVLLPIEPI